MTCRYKYIRHFYTQGNVKFGFKVGKICNFIACRTTVFRTEKIPIIKNDFFLSFLTALAYSQLKYLFF